MNSCWNLSYLYILENSFVSLLIIFLIILILWLKSFPNNKSSSSIDPNEQFRFKDCPPFYPNGWIPVLESRDLKTSKVKPVFVSGYDLVAFRGVSGRVYVMDAFCPHLGANIGYGGTVIGEEIKCPFHGWRFNNEGNCTRAHGVEKNHTPKVQIKVWNNCEVNGFIFVWNNSVGEEANWFIKPIEEINSQQHRYIGRSETLVNCHIQDIMENFADVMHINEIHSSPGFMRFPIESGSIDEFLLRYIHFDIISTRWNRSTQEHIAEIDIKARFVLGIFAINIEILLKTIGPAYFEIQSTVFSNFKTISTVAVFSRGPRQFSFVHNFYSKQWSPISFLISHLVKYYFPSQNERDAIIWNRKKYRAQPHLAKNESLLVEFRRWYKQFYAEQKTEGFKRNKED